MSGEVAKVAPAEKLKTAIDALDQDGLSVAEVRAGMDAITDCFVDLIGEKPTEQSVIDARIVFVDLARDLNITQGFDIYRRVLELALVKIASRANKKEQTGPADTIDAGHASATPVRDDLHTRTLAMLACQEQGHG